MKKLFLLLAAAFLIFPVGYAQESLLYGFYDDGNPQNDFLMLAQIDPLTGNILEIDTIPNIMGYALASSTFDQTNKYYIFKGLNTTFNMKLVSWDVENKTSVYDPPNETTINDFQYDMNSQTLYALGNYKVDSTLIDTTNGGVYMYEYASRFMAINIATSEETQMSLLPNLRAFPVGNSTFDANNGRYIVSGYDSLFTERIFVIDALTGEVLSDTPVPLENGQYLNELEYNNENDKLYGLFRDNNLGMAGIASVDLITGEISMLSEIENFWAFSPGASVFDQMNQQFILFYSDNAGEKRLLVYDVATQQQISDVPVNGNFTEIEVDNSAYAMLKYGTTILQEPEKDSEKLSVYPNPAISEFNVHCDDLFGTIRIFDMTGKELFKSTCAKRQNEMISSELFYPGIYFVRVETDENIHTQRVVIK